MGRATITGGGANGLYDIHVDYGSDRIQAKIDELTEYIDKLYGDLARAEADLDAADDEELRAQLEAQLQAAVDAYQAKVEENCSMEDWRTAPMEMEADFSVYNAARKAYENNLQDLYDLQQEMSEAGAKRAEAEIQIPLYEDAISAQEGYMDEIDSLLEDAMTLYRACVRGIKDPLSPECKASGDNVHALMAAVMMARQYLSELKSSLARYEHQRDNAEAEIDRLTPLIKAAEDLSDELRKAYLDARTEYNLTMNNNRAILEKCSPSRFLEQLKAVNNAIAKLRELDALKEELLAAVALLKAQIQAAYFERDNLINALAQGTTMDRDAWCVDLTEDGSGEVASLEIPGEPQKVVLAPGTRAPTDADGRLLSRYAMSAAQVVFNTAILPGWQKFKPTYRVGVLTAKDDDSNRGQVTLDVARSTATGIPRATRENAPWTRGGDAAGLVVNQESLGEIPFEYMECDSRAFSVGDRVVVEFRGMDWTNPYIIGFESWPKGCPTWGTIAYFIRNIFSDGGKRLYMRKYGYLTPLQVWGLETWSAKYSSIFCMDCWRVGTVTFSDNYIDLRESHDIVTVGRRSDKENVSFDVENPENALTIRQKQDGNQCLEPNGDPGVISYCPYYADGGASNYTMAESYQMASDSTYPVGTPQADGIIAMLGIPPKNSFDRWHEMGQANLAAIVAGGGNGTSVYIYALYEPPEEYEDTPWPPE